MSERIVRTSSELHALYGAPQPMTLGKLHDRLNDTARAFIARSPMLMLATASAAGHVEVSPKGDVAGFVEVVDERTILIPDRPGNRLIMGLKNIVENPQVAVAFLMPRANETLRLRGPAELVVDEAVNARLAARGRPALLAIRVHVEECFFHCHRAFARAHLWDPSSWTEPVGVDWVLECTGKDDPTQREAFARHVRDDTDRIAVQNQEPSP
jgi:PPOX class probable FMN-dependent enzyme